ncbi:gamma-mobile-trio protein GmtX [Pseudomonas sp. UBA2684]|uniref:gamma-mobile-trio protein GmtX n=1 Tax=Pseudomonas sp. UBA2684 TaxID=1947311 RepID=UPI0025FAD30E|nr:gamma-mobile-trio protein GmtX [Pseudomonas sp. UBA2684]|tara:strand:- start:31 stop:411 length:381 start_codon:yes stop_codon:yes gene_type:complete
MSEQLISPQETYERLIHEASDARRKRSLHALNEVCRLLHERNSSDFSYKTIITLGQDRGLSVPGEKSIVNATGAHYRELIQAWKLISVIGKSSAAPVSNSWIDMIEDPVLRLSVTLLAKELRACCC